LSLDGFDSIEYRLQVKMPAELSLIELIQCFAELHDLGPEKISQHLG
jgi:hypothetical protein